MLRQQLQQRLQQKLSPQQIQLMRLLELPAVELEERVKHELEENPALEEGKDILHDNDELDEPISDNDNADSSNDNIDSDTDLSLGDYMTEDDIPEYKLREISEQSKKRGEIPLSDTESINDYLLQQLGMKHLSEKESTIAKYIIGSIDDDGYLRRELSSVADDLMFSEGIIAEPEELEKALAIVKDLDPAGVASGSLQESLSIQLERRKHTKENRLAATIVKNFFDDFSKKHYDKIKRSLNIDDETLKRVIKEITALNPKPCAGLDNSMDSAMITVVPDFMVDIINGEPVLSMNNRGVPQLIISREYEEMLQDYAGNKKNQTSSMRDAVQFVKQKLDSAQWFIDAVKQRQETLLRTMEAILILQKDFFLTGEETSLRPMILKDVAQKAGYDISTVSRVSNSKYVQTSFGIYPLKYFFSESMQNENGEEVSTREVKKIMKDHIDEEDKRKPLTDEELAAILKEKGYVIARRTVAKYREQLDIPVARLRKEI